MISSAILIPARYNSTRFEGKPLCMLDGVPMIRRVAEACASAAYRVFVVTDDHRIADLFDPEDVIITSADCDNGTERCAEALNDPRLKGYDNIINVQGDMPDVTVEMIECCVESLRKYDVSTVYTELPDELQNDPNTVKCIIGDDNTNPKTVDLYGQMVADDKVLWLGRGFTYGVQHLGVYGYRRRTLRRYPDLIVPEEEDQEKIECLRFLKRGVEIGISKVKFDGIEINTPDDAMKWNNKNFTEVWSI